MGGHREGGYLRAQCAMSGIVGGKYPHFTITTGFEKKTET